MVDRGWLKSTRIYLKLSCEDVAKMMSTTKQTISNIETGRSKNKMAMAFYEKTLVGLLKDRFFTKLFEGVNQNDIIR